MSAQIPVTVLTGYLGAGKTTLLNRVLSEDHGKKFAVIVNEFGEIGIDSDLVVGADEEVFEMNNGCICCTVRGDLIRIIGGLLKRKGKFDAILVETTGLADPAPVAQTFFADEDVKKRTKLDSVLTVVDAKHVLQRLADSPEAKDQIAFADILLLNKTDAVSADELAKVEQKLGALNPFARIHKTERCNIAIDKILDQGSFDLSRILDIKPHFLPKEKHGHDHDHKHDHHDHDHHHGHDHGADEHYHDEDMDSISLSTDKPLNPAKFNDWINDVLASKGQTILRSKGILNLADAENRYVFQAVHMMSEGAFAGPWPAKDSRKSRMVFIGRDLDFEALKAGFKACEIA
ncbi:MAG: GTP-binding protein [Rhodospirillaceae bacterium]|nr:GTP-binding protein [Rhodospirillaceae bacterium]